MLSPKNFQRTSALIFFLLNTITANKNLKKHDHGRKILNLKNLNIGYFAVFSCPDERFWNTERSEGWNNHYTFEGMVHYISPSNPVQIRKLLMENPEDKILGYVAIVKSTYLTIKLREDQFLEIFPKYDKFCEHYRYEKLLSPEFKLETALIREVTVPSTKMTLSYTEGYPSMFRFQEFENDENGESYLDFDWGFFMEGVNSAPEEGGHGASNEDGYGFFPIINSGKYILFYKEYDQEILKRFYEGDLSGDGLGDNGREHEYKALKEEKSKKNAEGSEML